MVDTWEVGWVRGDWLRSSILDSRRIDPRRGMYSNRLISRALVAVMNSYRIVREKKKGAEGGEGWKLFTKQKGHTNITISSLCASSLEYFSIRRMVGQSPWTQRRWSIVMLIPTAKLMVIWLAFFRLWAFDIVAPRFLMIQPISWGIRICVRGARICGELSYLGLIRWLVLVVYIGWIPGAKHDIIWIGRLI